MSENLEAPLAIFLQTLGWDGLSSDEITWCAEKISETDEFYIRADLVQEIINGNEIAKDSVLTLIKNSNT